jgi:hypothetical protein
MPEGTCELAAGFGRFAAGEDAAEFPVLPDGAWYGP